MSTAAVVQLRATSGCGTSRRKHCEAGRFCLSSRSLAADIGSVRQSSCLRRASAVGCPGFRERAIERPSGRWRTLVSAGTTRLVARASAFETASDARLWPWAGETPCFRRFIRSRIPAAYRKPADLGVTGHRQGASQSAHTRQTLAFDPESERGRIHAMPGMPYGRLRRVLSPLWT